jgi:hypothetical protein
MEQVEPLMVKLLGFGLPEPLALKPIWVLDPGGSVPFQLKLTALTLAPLWVQVALQPWEICWLPGKANRSVQLLRVVVPVLVIVA